MTSFLIAVAMMQSKARLSELLQKTPWTYHKSCIIHGMMVGWPQSHCTLKNQPPGHWLQRGTSRNPPMQCYSLCVSGPACSCRYCMSLLCSCMLSFCRELSLCLRADSRLRMRSMCFSTRLVCNHTCVHVPHCFFSNVFKRSPRLQNAEL